VKTKTAYRPKNIPSEEAPAPNIPDEPPQPSETTRIEFTNGADKAEPAVAIVSADEIPSPDEATLALQRQLADLRKSEELQRNYAQQMMAARAQPPTREQLLQSWRSQGADENDLSFLQANPELIDNPALTRVASEEAAQQGHERGTDAHRQATREIFHQHLQAQQAQPAASAQPAPTPEYFRPSPQPAPSRPDPSAYVSAPVSRGVPSGETGYRPARQIKLTPQEQEYARVAGISDVEYARQKQKLAQAKLAGDYGERR
jgi:hypothetical protein